MRNALAITLFGTLFAIASVAYSGAACADPLGQTQTVDGMVVYLGLMPVDNIRQYPTSYPKHDQSRFPSGKNAYHVLLALFESSNGERITDAVIEAISKALPEFLGENPQNDDITLIAIEKH